MVHDLFPTQSPNGKQFLTITRLSSCLNAIDSLERCHITVIIFLTIKTCFQHFLYTGPVVQSGSDLAQMSTMRSAIEHQKFNVTILKLFQAGYSLSKPYSPQVIAGIAYI